MTEAYTQLCGLGTALITPFRSDGSIDDEALRRLLDRQIAGGADYLVVLGTTGEAATLTRTEKIHVITTVTDYVRGRLPLVLGLGGNNTAAVVEELAELAPVLKTHFCAILSVCPYYNKPSQEGLFRHFKAVAEASPVPVILYNVPGRTGVNMLPETVIRLREAVPERIIAIKEASGDTTQIRRLISMAEAGKVNTAGQRMLVISGDDGITAELMDAGADGLISVAANAFPDVFRRIVHCHDHSLQQEYASMVRLLFAEGNPAGIKTVLALQGAVENILRLPLVANSEKVQEEIKLQLKHLENPGK